MRLASSTWRWAMAISTASVGSPGGYGWSKQVYLVLFGILRISSVLSSTTVSDPVGVNLKRGGQGELRVNVDRRDEKRTKTYMVGLFRHVAAFATKAYENAKTRA